MRNGASIEVRKTIPAPPEEVFRWWTEPALLARWMAPRGYAEADVNLRVGGHHRIVMKDGEFSIDHFGDYVEIESPHRLVFTWNSRFTNGDSLVTVSLTPVGEGSTEVVIVHSGLPDKAAPSHAGGWGTMLERMLEELAA